MPAPLILASGSRYRRELLQRLGVPFAVEAAAVDEGARPDEPPNDLVHRLARAKALAVAARHADALVIGSDQVAVCRGRILGKPGDAKRNVEQLQDASGTSVTFLTAVCLARAGQPIDAHLDVTVARFRELGRAEIERYVERERAFDCAGGFKAEGLGIALFERVESQDPTGLIGLPLIWLAAALRRAGVPVP
jgi:septum formation protein